jgi:hypothetical protein
MPNRAEVERECYAATWHGPAHPSAISDHLTDEWGEKEGRRWSIRERVAADGVRGGATAGPEVERAHKI